MADNQYLKLCSDILYQGIEKSDRTGTGTKSLFGKQLRFNLQEGFPLLTTKKVHWKSIVGELLWFLSGSTSADELKEKYGVTIWNEWKDEFGQLGPVYGKQWVDWGGFDICSNKIIDGYNAGINQIQNVIDTLNTDPDSRRMVVSAWNVSELDSMALQPCHVLFQFYTAELTLQERCDYWCTSIGKSKYSAEDLHHKQLDTLKVPRRKISLQLYQRSADMFLGVPFNIASYSLLLTMIANQVNMIPYEFIHTIGDAHVYLNHTSQILKQQLRSPKTLPTVNLNAPTGTSIFDIKQIDIILENYKPHPSIKGKVSI
jgi:thymidylate synthase